MELDPYILERENASLASSGPFPKVSARHCPNVCDQHFIQSIVDWRYQYLPPPCFTMKTWSVTEGGKQSLLPKVSFILYMFFKFVTFFFLWTLHVEALKVWAGDGCHGASALPRGRAETGFDVQDLLCTPACSCHIYNRHGQGSDHARAKFCFSCWVGWSWRAPTLFLLVCRCLWCWRWKRASLALLAAFYEHCYTRDLSHIWTSCELQAAV